MKLGPCQPLLPYLCHCKPTSVIISGSSSSVHCLALAALTVRLAGSSPSVGEPGLNKSLINQGAADTSSIFIATVRCWRSGTSTPRIIRSLRGPSQALHGSSAFLPFPFGSLSQARPRWYPRNMALPGGTSLKTRSRPVKFVCAAGSD